MFIRTRDAHKAFTLIELSIVLVIIGLIAGGVLVGRDLINAAAIRAQISQIESFQTATNTFKGKYGYLPGDIPNPDAPKFGFLPRGTQSGTGDGNGIITGNLEYTGEIGAFWNDLATAKLIAGNFTGDPREDSGLPATTLSGEAIGTWFPPAKLRGGLFVYTHSGGSNGHNQNYLGLANIQALLGVMGSSHLYTYDKLTVSEAFNIDKKIDDGIPQHGKVLASYIHGGLYGWAGHDWYGTGIQTASDGSPRDDLSDYPGDGTSCYHNTSGVTGPMHYAIGTNLNTQNCALSFKFQ